MWYTNICLFLFCFLISSALAKTPHEREEERINWFMHEKGIAAIPESPDFISWNLPDTIEICGVKYTLSPNARWYSIIDRKGEVSWNVMLNILQCRTHKESVEHTVCSLVNTPMAISDDEIIKRFSFSKDGKYLAIKDGRRCGIVIYGNVEIFVARRERDCNTGPSGYELAKAILEAGLKKAEEEE